jgi:uncharacterized protein involved in exopolysaccharide biosynthesis
MRRVNPSRTPRGEAPDPGLGLDVSRRDPGGNPFHVRLPVPEFSLRDAFRAVTRHWRKALALYAGVVAAVALYAFFWPPTYEARIRFLVKHDRQEPLLSAEQGGVRMLARSMVTEEDLNSEVAIMQSAAVIERAIQDIGIDAFQEHWAVRVLNWPIERAAALYDWHHDQPGPTPMQKAVVRLRRKLSATPQKKSAIIEVALQWGHPEAAVRILESLSSSYVTQHLQLMRNPERQTFFWTQAERKKAEIEKIDEEIRLIRLGSGGGALNLEKELAVKSLSDQEAELRRIHSQRVRLLARVAFLERQMGVSANVPVFEIVRNSKVSEEMRHDLVSARTELGSLTEYQRACEGDIQRYRSEISILNQDSVKVQRLEREQKSAEASYLAYARQHEESVADDEMNRSRFVNVAAIEPVRAESKPVKPRRGLLLALALGIGVFLAVGFAFFLEALGRRAWLLEPGESSSLDDASPDRGRVGSSRGSGV